MRGCKKSVFELLYTFSRTNPNFIYLENEEDRYTISEFFNTVCSTANTFVRNGVKKGDVVTILSKKDIETIIYFFACQIIGAVAFMIDSHENIDDIENVYGLSVKYHIGDNRRIDKVKYLPMLEFNDFEDTKETTIMIFTSGSTGERKIVKLSQYAFINNSYDSAPFGCYSNGDVALAFLPMNHVFAIAMLFTTIFFHFKVVVAKCADIPYLLECIERYHVTRFNGIPSLFLKMVDLKNNYDVSSLKCAYIGGAPCSLKDFLKIEEELGIKLISVYGMSECIGISTGSYYDDSTILANSVGRCYPANKIKIDSDGEIMVKSPAMCNGYYNGELPIYDGYLLTGDLGEFDKDGYLHIIGRKKEIIIRNGNNISIPEIEKKLNDVALFKEYVVVGINDDNVGESPALAVVLNKDVNKEDINIELSKYLTKIEMPSQIICINSIPLLDNGKIDKQTVKKLFI